VKEVGRKKMSTSEQQKEWGVLRREEGGHISWASIYRSEEDARDHATPLDSVEFRWVSDWQSV